MDGGTGQKEGRGGGMTRSPSDMFFVQVGCFSTDEAEPHEDDMIHWLGSKSLSPYDRLFVILSDMARFIESPVRRDLLGRRYDLPSGLGGVVGLGGSVRL